MKDESKKNNKIMNELVKLRKRIKEMERSETEHKKTEDALKESEEQFRDLVENANDLIQGVTPEGKFLFVNRKWRETLGYSKKDIAGLSLFDIIHPDSQAHCKEIFKRVIFGEKIEKIEAVFVARDGKEIIIEGNASCLFKEGRPVTTFGIFRDTSERKRMEEQLKKVLEELKQRNQELDEYTYTVSHELKTPLIAIQGFSAILYKKCRNKLNKNMVQYLKRISLASERLERMVSDLLKLSRAGRKTGKFNEVDINSVVKTSLKHFESSIIEKHIDVKLTPEFPTVSCDRSRIIEVFDNLIANAVRFAGSQEKPKIKIGWKKQKDQYQFWVEDNGVGIIEGDKKKIFKTFVQGSLVSSEEGTGVGLSIAKKVIESHGGRIWVKSGLGSGATFYFTIPL